MSIFVKTTFMHREKWMLKPSEPKEKGCVSDTDLKNNAATKNSFTI